MGVAFGLVALLGALTGCSSADSFEAAVDAGSDSAQTAQDAAPTPAVDAGAPDTSDAAPLPAGPFTIGGTVVGLLGTGMIVTINDGDPLAIAGNGPFVFPHPLAAGTAYKVLVQTRPSSPAQVCTLSNGTGVVDHANVTNLELYCRTTSGKLSGTISGLTGTGLVLNDGSEDLPIHNPGSFLFPTPIMTGTPYNVTVKQQPTGPIQTCTVSAGSGVMPLNDVTGVVVNCDTSSYTVGGTVTGLKGTLVLTNDYADDRVITADGAFAFATPLLSSTGYYVSVKTQPTSPSQTCTVTNGTGQVTTSNITNVAVSCTTNTFSIGGTLKGSIPDNLILENNGGDDLNVFAWFRFNTKVPSGSTYSVTVKSQIPGHYCYIEDGTGTVTNADITNVVVNCPDHNTWTLVAPMRSEHGLGAGALGTDGRIYAIGGEGGDASYRAVDAYSAATNTWTKVADMPRLRRSHAAATGADGRIYAIGGYVTASTPDTTVDVYTPSTNTWSTVAPMPLDIALPSAALAGDGNIYVFGFYGGGAAIGAVLRYVPSTNTWSKVAGLLSSRTGSASVAANGYLWLMGGTPYGGTANEAFNYVVDTWGSAAPIPFVANGPSAAALSDGRILLVDRPGAALYAFSTNSWTSTAAMNVPRTLSAAATAPDGRVVVFGGLDADNNRLSSVEIYTP